MHQCRSVRVSGRTSDGLLALCLEAKRNLITGQVGLVFSGFSVSDSSPEMLRYIQTTCSFLYYLGNRLLSLLCAIFFSASSCFFGWVIDWWVLGRQVCLLPFYFFALQRESVFPLQTTVGPCHKDSHWRMKDPAPRKSFKDTWKSRLKPKRDTATVARDFISILFMYPFKA